MMQQKERDRAEGRRRWIVTGLAAVTMLGAAVASWSMPGRAGALTAARAVPVAAQPAPTPGYWLAGLDGGVFSFNAPFDGSGYSTSPNACAPSGCRGIASTPTGSGYWLVNKDRLPDGFGQAMATPQSCTPLNGATGNWVGVASSASGRGFWDAGSNGGVIGCGDAPPPFGGLSGVRLEAPVVAIVATSDHGGYWLVAADGGVFSYGDARFYGSLASTRLDAPIVGAATTGDGGGYWLVGADGGVFAFGDAAFQGSMGGRRLNAPMVAMAANPDGTGYWTVAADGGVFSYGDAPFEGSMGGHHLDSPIVGMAARP